MPQKENIDLDFCDLVSRSEIATTPALDVAEADTFYVLNDYPHKLNKGETTASATARLKAAGFIDVGTVLID